MSPRPRTVTDTDILMAAASVISKVGPTRLTLAHVGRAIGLSPGALIKRFGSKRGLLLAMSRQAVESVDACFAAVRTAHPAPLDAFVAAALEMTRYVQTPEDDQRPGVLCPHEGEQHAHRGRLPAVAERSGAGRERWNGATRRGWHERSVRW